VEETYSLINGVISSLGSHFPDEFMHFGGDELRWSCWTDTEHVRRWMANMSFAAHADALSYFESRIHTGDKNMVVWQEMLNDGVHLASSSVIQGSVCGFCVRSTPSIVSLFAHFSCVCVFVCV
jgi:hexosaminidase